MFHDLQIGDEFLIEGSPFRCVKDSPKTYRREDGRMFSVDSSYPVDSMQPWHRRDACMDMLSWRRAVRGEMAALSSKQHTQNTTGG